MPNRIKIPTSRPIHNYTSPISVLGPMCLVLAVWMMDHLANSQRVSNEERRDQKNRARSGLGLLPRCLPAKIDSFTALRSHLLSLQLNERLQLLSWLFEGALASCTHEFNESVQSAVHTDSREVTEQIRHGHSKRRQGYGAKPLQWSPEDDARLLNMTEERCSWPEIKKSFPQRTYSALRQRQSTLRKQSTPQEQRNKTRLRPVVLI
ncbi:hypothetical protein ACJ73_08518 [Blastomyces percursus]|uniref:Myb-like domain-containing protein n=1 Tax=Blastomyces percursus TaxID=1658174 RepID=A0A1J9PV37_9EURO|nr:hypothetical protein ACJ73_08518 [Blastomyces percursus]